MNEAKTHAFLIDKREELIALAMMAKCVPVSQKVFLFIRFMDSCYLEFARILRYVEYKQRSHARKV